MLVHGKALRQFESLSDDMESMEILTEEYIIKGLALYFSPVNLLSKQKRAMRRGMEKPRYLKVRRYAAQLIDLNEYLDLFPGDKLSEKIGVNDFIIIKQYA